MKNSKELLKEIKQRFYELNEDRENKLDFKSYKTAALEYYTKGYFDKKTQNKR